tara:strand:- start:4 stop:756 length:753 start_codon:yes stop_codon:yes gene_type:complete
MAKLLLKKSYRRDNLKEVHFKDLWGSFGIFTTMRVLGKPPKIFLYKEHLNNLIKSLKFYNLNQKKLKKDLVTLIKHFLVTNISYDHLLRVACNKNFISISLRKRHKPNNKFYLQLFNYKRVDPHLKNLKYKKILKQLNKYDTKKNDVALFSNNNFLETCTSNLLFIRGNDIYSPSKNIYKGITYKYFNKKIKIKNKNISIKEIDKYSEILLLGSGKGVTSVFKIPSLYWKRKNNKIHLKLNKIYKKGLSK